ncbi:MAG: alpha-L-fucosidase [Chloroflexi bacterium]|nr:alpha-L-fucosidase [Chloroflexota bacterium]
MSAAGPYEPTAESLSRHTVPEWYAGAKLGLMIHWGPYSVPGWAERSGNIQDLWAKKGPAYQFRHNPYAEWYRNTIQIAGSGAQRHHHETYGRDYPYEEFGRQFGAASAKADFSAWAELFARAGARYAVLTAKHMDGYPLWPSRHANPRAPSYHSKRDLVGDWAEAVRARGLKMGLYYCGGYDGLFNGTVIRDPLTAMTAIPQGQEFSAHAEGQLTELIERYEPSVLWNDIAYPAGADVRELLALYYNTVADGAVNDRWAQVRLPRSRIGKAALAATLRMVSLLWPVLPASWRRLKMLPAAHCDFITPEYEVRHDISGRKWEAVRGIGHSFGINRAEREEDLLSVEELVRLLADVVSKNGNLLLGIAPEPDGRFPEMQTRRLLALGDWLVVNGEAIYGSRPWVRAEGTTLGGPPVRFTRNDEAVFAIVMGTPSGTRLRVEGIVAGEGATVGLLGSDGALAWERDGDALAVTLPGAMPSSPAHTLRISPAASVALSTA